MREYMKDLGARMKEIKSALDTTATPSATAAAATAPTAATARTEQQLRAEEALLDELAEIVESVDHARDLTKVGGLETLLSLMACPYPSLRWRAAEVAATCMANNPPVQRWFMDGGAAAALMGLLGDRDLICRTKALLALSALVRHYDPGLEAFRAAGGLGHLLAMIGAGGGGGGSAAAAGDDDRDAPAAGRGGRDDDEAAAEAAAAERRLRRKALALLQYVCAKRPADAVAAARLGAPAALAAILSDPAAGSDLRLAALEVLLEIAAEPAGWAELKQGAPALPPLLTRLAARHAALPAEDREAEGEEAEAAGKLAALLAAAAPPAPVAGRPTFDHIDLDRWQETGGGNKTVELRAGAGGGAAAAAGGASEPVEPQQKPPALPLGLPAPPQ
jgi:hsp70-interacting protein